jgi:hypothetical protein
VAAQKSGNIYRPQESHLSDSSHLLCDIISLEFRSHDKIDTYENRQGFGVNSLSRGVWCVRLGRKK